MLQINITGIGGIKHYLTELPSKLDHEMMKSSEEFSIAVQKIARIKAPRMTGNLINSIIIKKGRKNVSVNVTAPYAVAQDEGFKPHFVHALLSTRNSLGTIGDAYNTAGFVYVRKHTPFISPALSAGLSQLSAILDRRINRAIK